jgi:chromate transporter
MKWATRERLTALIAIVCLAVLFRFKVSNPMVIGATAIVGLIALPIIQPPARVFVQ